MQKRLIISERIFEALSRSNMEGSRIRKKTICNSKSEDETVDNILTPSPVDNFAKLGARAGLSFAFAFLKKTWRSGTFLGKSRTVFITTEYMTFILTLIIN